MRIVALMGRERGRLLAATWNRRPIANVNPQKRDRRALALRQVIRYGVRRSGKRAAKADEQGS